MPKYVWCIRALSPRDGGWVRLHGHFPSEDLAWQWVIFQWPLMVLANDYVTVDVFKTIKF